MPTPCGLVLYYHAGPETEAAQAKLVFIRFGLRLKCITPDQLGQAVGSFAGLNVPAPESRPARPIPDSLLIFADLPGKTLDQVLAALRKAGVSRSVFKAVITPQNAAWSFYQLYEELKEERQAIEQDNSKS